MGLWYSQECNPGSSESTQVPPGRRNDPALAMDDRIGRRADDVVGEDSVNVTTLTAINDIESLIPCLGFSPAVSGYDLIYSWDIQDTSALPSETPPQ